MSYIIDKVDLNDYQTPALPACPRCGVDVIEENHWRRASDSERDEMLEDGFVRMGHDGLCVMCDSVQIFTPKIRYRLGLRGDTVRVYRELTAKGLTTQEIADHIGIKRKSLLHALSEHRKKGLV